MKEFSYILEKVFADNKISRSEKEAIEKVLDAKGFNDQQLSLLRSQLFNFVQKHRFVSFCFLSRGRVLPSTVALSPRATDRHPKNVGPTCSPAVPRSQFRRLVVALEA